MQNNERKTKNSKARIKANDRYNKANYKNISIRVKPDQADEIRATAENLHQSLAQLIINAVRAYADIQTNHGADTAQPEQDPTQSPMESGETAEAQPEEETEADNEIETEEENQTAGAEEEPQEDEDEDEKPEDIPAFVWEQIQRLKKADKRHTAERKAREAAERKRRRIGEDAEDY